MSEPLASIWIGNRTRIPAHQDLPDNLACVVAGRRRVTLFPPQQLSNLYIGPLDFNPAGQAISLVDFDAPDYDRFPKFAEASQARAGRGTRSRRRRVHSEHVVALHAGARGLQRAGQLLVAAGAGLDGYADERADARYHDDRDLPPNQREIWDDVFRHYVFAAGEATNAHIPGNARGVLGPFDDDKARALRARLLQRLNR